MTRPRFLTDQDILNVIAIASRENRKRKRWKSAAAKTIGGKARCTSGPEDALRMVKNSEIAPEEMSVFEIDRIRNIKTYVDVLTKPDFSYRNRDKIIYGKNMMILLMQKVISQLSLAFPPMG